MLALWPTSDDVGVAIAAAARALKLDPLQVAAGSTETWAYGRARLYAACSLRSLFGADGTPGAPGNTSFSRMVGGHKSLLTMFDKDSRPRWWNTEISAKVKQAIINARTDPPGITLRRKPVPLAQCLDVTPNLMGDPPKGRSALTEYLKREAAKQAAAHAALNRVSTYQFPPLEDDAALTWIEKPSL